MCYHWSWWLERVGTSLKKYKQFKILDNLKTIFEPLPQLRSDNNNNNNHNNDDGDEYRKTITSSTIQSMVLLLSLRKNECRMLNISIDVFKWRLLFVCSIIISFT